MCRRFQPSLWDSRVEAIWPPAINCWAIIKTPSGTKNLQKFWNAPPFDMSGQKLGQHFLVAEHKADRILELGEITPKDFIVEIGPGKGFLTERILLKGNRFAAIELDKYLSEKLKKKYYDKTDCQIFTDDAAKFDYNLLESPFKVISNLPYNAAVPILARLFEFKGMVPLMVLMFQLEVAQRITAEPGGKSYNALSILAQYHTAATLEFSLSKNDFFPKPKVDSAVVKFIPYATPPFAVDNEDFFFSLVKMSFSQRRKKIINNLKTLPVDIVRIENACRASEIDPGVRAETVSIAAFARLSNILCKGEGKAKTKSL